MYRHVSCWAKNKMYCIYRLAVRANYIELINFLYRILSSVACNCNSNVIQQLTFRRRKNKKRTERTKSNKKEKKEDSLCILDPQGCTELPLAHQAQHCCVFHQTATETPSFHFSGSTGPAPNPFQKNWSCSRAWPMVNPRPLGVRSSLPVAGSMSLVHELWNLHCPWNYILDLTKNCNSSCSSF